MQRLIVKILLHYTINATKLMAHFKNNYCSTCKNIIYNFKNYLVFSLFTEFMVYGKEHLSQPKLVLKKQKNKIYQLNICPLIIID